MKCHKNILNYYNSISESTFLFDLGLKWMNEIAKRTKKYIPYDMSEFYD